jgi:predicted AAA+ superfamily ATPase
MSIGIDLIDQNPWWKKREAIKQDKHLVALSHSSIKWEPRIGYKFNFDSDIVYTLRGPRQVGKTTLLKELISGFLSKGVEPRTLFYYTCDLIDNPKELVNTVNTYLDTTRPTPKERAYIFLDEISSVRDWQKAIKHLHDTGKLVNTTLILTGSHSIDIKKAYEKLPGRRGDLQDVPDKILLPMKFVEYVETVNKEIRSAISDLRLIEFGNRKKILLDLSQGKIPEKIKSLSLYSKELDLLFKDYLLTGGIPRVIDEYFRTRQISEGVYRTYVDVVLGDLAKWNKRETYLRQILRKIMEAAGNPTGWNTLRKGTDIASHNTVADYVDTLKDSFVVYYLGFYDTSKKIPLYEKDKKIHFYDPFFYHALRGWITGQDPFTTSTDFMKNPQYAGMLAESVVGNHLIRLAFNISQQKQLFDYENALFYWRSGKDREVDFVIKLDENSVLPLEVKYQSEITKGDLYGIIDFKKSAGSKMGILLSRDKMEVKGGIVILPVWLFLMIV